MELGNRLEMVLISLGISFLLLNLVETGWMIYLQAFSTDPHRLKKYRVAAAIHVGLFFLSCLMVGFAWFARQPSITVLVIVLVGSSLFALGVAIQDVLIPNRIITWLRERRARKQDGGSR